MPGLNEALVQPIKDDRRYSCDFKVAGFMTTSTVIKCTSTSICQKVRNFKWVSEIVNN